MVSEINETAAAATAASGRAHTPDTAATVKF